MRGPKPKSIEERQREQKSGGTINKRPVPEPILIGGRPGLRELDEPPEHLPPEAKEYRPAHRGPGRRRGR